MIVRSIEEFDAVENNKIIGRPVSMKGSKINFRGENNILFIDEKVNLDDTSLNFLGSNSIIFLASNRHVTRVQLDIYNNSVFYLGKDANTTRAIHVILSEERHVIIGNDCLFSRDVWFRNGDPHLIYDCETKERINVSRSIYLGDHVWIAQNVLLTKGTQIGSGTMVGGWSMTGGKKMLSNCAYGGCPAKLVKKDIFWDKPSVHVYTRKETEESMHYEGKKKLIYKNDGKQLPFSVLDEKLSAIEKADDRLEYLMENVYNNKSRNRFCIKEKAVKPQNGGSGMKRSLKKLLGR